MISFLLGNSGSCHLLRTRLAGQVEEVRRMLSALVQSMKPDPP
jgi:hypothetical protein